MLQIGNYVLVIYHIVSMLCYDVVVVCRLPSGHGQISLIIGHLLLKMSKRHDLVSKI